MSDDIIFDFLILFFGIAYIYCRKCADYLESR